MDGRSRRQKLPEDRRSQEDQLVHDRINSRHHGDLRDHGVRTDRGLPGRDVPDQDPLHLDVAAVSHWQRLVRWNVAPTRHGGGGRAGRYLRRSLVSDHGGGDDVGGRPRLPARYQRRRYHYWLRCGHSERLTTGEGGGQPPPSPFLDAPQCGAFSFSATDELEHHFAATRPASMFDEVDALPGPEREFSVGYWHMQ